MNERGEMDVRCGVKTITKQDPSFVWGLDLPQDSLEEAGGREENAEGNTHLVKKKKLHSNAVMALTSTCRVGETV